MPIRTVAFDGDDTLWHNESHFHFTQTEFRELLMRHVPDADVDARLFATEMANLSLYGYGIKSFTLSMLETAIEVTEGKIPASDLAVILGWGKRVPGGKSPASDLAVVLGWGKQMPQEPRELLDGATEALREVSRRYTVM